MSDLTTGSRVTVRHHVEGYAGQHGTVSFIDPAVTSRPVYVRLDGDTDPTRFSRDELGPYTEDPDVADRERDLDATLTLLGRALDRAGVVLGPADRPLVGWLAGLGETGRQVVRWMNLAHDAGALAQRQATARAQLATIDPRFVTNDQWDALACILCGTPLKAGERIGEINGYIVYACTGGCATGSEHSSNPAPAGEEKITGGAACDAERNGVAP